MRTVTAAVLAATLSLQLLYTEMTTASSVPKRTGVVRVERGVLTDAGGPFWALGATYMAAAWFYKFDRHRLERNLEFLARGGIQYIRVLAEVGGGDNDFWRGRETDPRWPDYDQVLAGLTDLAFDRFGMRVQWTVFGGTGFSTTPEARAALVDRVVNMAAARPHEVLLVEIGNEAWQNGFEGDRGIAELRALTTRARQALRAKGLSIPVAPSAAPSSACDDMRALYQGLDAEIAMVHVERDLGQPEGPWRPVRLPWDYAACKGLPAVASNNEPIGPASSVDSESEPVRLVSAALVTFIAKLPLYVFHSRAGVRGDIDFADLPRVTATLGGFRSLHRHLPPALPTGERLAPGDPGHPLQPASPGGNGQGPAGTFVAAYASVLGDEVFVAPVGLRGKAEFRATRSVSLDVIDLLNGRVLSRHALEPGQPLVLQGRPAFLLKGTLR